MDKSCYNCGNINCPDECDNNYSEWQPKVDKSVTQTEPANGKYEYSKVKATSKNVGVVNRFNRTTDTDEQHAFNEWAKDKVMLTNSYDNITEPMFTAFKAGVEWERNRRKDK